LLCLKKELELNRAGLMLMNMNFADPKISCYLLKIVKSYNPLDYETWVSDIRALKNKQQGTLHTS
jgi:hypothetical protein